MHRLLIASLLVFAAISCAQAQSPFSPEQMQKLEAQTLPFASFWISNRGTQLKLYGYSGQSPDGPFGGVVNSASAPPGCQYQTFELLPKAGYGPPPMIVFAVAWKNWTVDCHAQTVWEGILNGNKLQLERMRQRVSAKGKIIPAGKVDHETFTRMP